MLNYCWKENKKLIWVAFEKLFNNSNCKIKNYKVYHFIQNLFKLNAKYRTLLQCFQSLCHHISGLRVWKKNWKENSKSLSLVSCMHNTVIVLNVFTNAYMFYAISWLVYVQTMKQKNFKFKLEKPWINY